MTIKNPEAFIAGVWDWGILRGCFGETKIEPTDIDGLVERKGKFLIIEAKAPSANLQVGQEITFEALRQTGLFTIIVVWGETNKSSRIEVWTREGKFPIRTSGLKTLRKIVAKWFLAADNGLN